MTSKVLNIHTLHKMKFGRRRPSEATIRKAYEEAGARGHCIAADGRAYVPNSVGTPKGMRWQNGKLIPRHAKR